MALRYHAIPNKNDEATPDPTQRRRWVKTQVAAALITFDFEPFWGNN